MLKIKPKFYLKISVQASFYSIMYIFTAYSINMK